MAAQYNAAAPTLPDKAKTPLQVDSLGNLKTAPGAGGSKAPASSQSVIGAGLEYETVAASQTAQAIGATGATGDYLSHVVIQPVTTAAVPTA